MSVLVVGLSHRSAPVSLLEEVTRGLGDSAELLAELATGAVSEAVVLTTCNRVEVYTDSEAFHAGMEGITELLTRRTGVALEELSKHLYVHWEGQAVQHLFQVASGLDSMVIGESQILGQLRRAYGASAHAGRVLHELFQSALRVGKRVHSETGIDAAGRSLVSVGLAHAAEVLGPLAGRRVLVVGAGSMGALAGATLRRAGVGELVVANRSIDNARRLALSLDGRGVGLDALQEQIAASDLVVSSTGATGTVVSRDVVAAALAGRDRDLVFLDLAMPRDVEPLVRSLPGVTLVDLEMLQAALHGSDVQADVEAARAIVADEVGGFLGWQRASRVAPTVVALRSRADEVVTAELERLSNRVPGLDPDAQREVEQTVRRVVQTLLHTPTVRVKELAEAPAGLSYAEALRELFGLDPAAPAAVAGSLALDEDERP